MDAQTIQDKVDGMRQGLAQLEQQREQVERAIWAQRGAIVAMEQLLSEMQPEPQGEPEGGETDGPSNS